MRGRPRQFDREHALLLARNLFWSKGYAGTSLSDLMHELDLSKASLYAAFGSKSELFRETISLYDRTEGGFIQRALLEETDLFALLKRILFDGIETFTAFPEHTGCMLQVSSMNYDNEGKIITNWLTENRQLRHGEIKKKIQEIQIRSTCKRSFEHDSLAEMYCSFLQGVAVQARDGVSKRKLLKSANVFLSLLRANPNI